MLVMGPGVRSDYVVRIAASHMMVEEDDNGGPDRDLDLAATLTTDDDLRYFHFQVRLEVHGKLTLTCKSVFLG